MWMKIHEYPLKCNSGANPSNFGASSTPNNAGGNFVNFSGTVSQVQGMIVHALNALQVREIWFVLLEEEATTATATSILDSKNTHDTAFAVGAMEKEELKFTYQEDREEISSLASISSLAGYNNTDKGLISKLSEIKTSTVENQKP